MHFKVLLFAALVAVASAAIGNTHLEWEGELDFNYVFTPGDGRIINSGPEGMTYTVQHHHAAHHNDDDDDADHTTPAPEEPTLYVLTSSTTMQRGVICKVDTTLPGNYDVGACIELNNATLSHVPTELAGITINREGNFVVVGKRIDENPHNAPERAVAFFVRNVPGHEGEQVNGPVAVTLPVCNPTGIAFDHWRNTYWITDRDANILEEALLTCCETSLALKGPLYRWGQQLRPKSIWGLEYGLRGYTNIFEKRNAPSGHHDDNDDHDSHHDDNDDNDDHHAHHNDDNDDHERHGKFPKKKHGWGKRPAEHFISIPAFSDPEDVSLDSSTMHLWVLNDAPTTVLYEMDQRGVVRSWHNLEQYTNYEDANALAVSAHHVAVGFDDEAKIVLFKKSVIVEGVLAEQDDHEGHGHGH